MYWPHLCWWQKVSNYVANNTFWNRFRSVRKCVIYGILTRFRTSFVSLIWFMFSLRLTNCFYLFTFLNKLYFLNCFLLLNIWLSKYYTPGIHGQGSTDDFDSCFGPWIPYLFSFFPDSFPFFNRFFSTVKFFPLYKIWSLYFWMIKIVFTLRLLILFSYWRLLQYQTKKIRIKKIVEPAPRPPNIVTVERLCAAM